MRTFLLLIFPLLVFSQKNNHEALDKYMDQQVKINRFGGSVLIMKNDSVVLKKAYGHANLEWDVKNTTDTKFVLASITKYFTAIAIMQLIERNKLSPDDKLIKFFPAYPNGDKVTMHMLLTHTSGLPLDFEEMYMNETAVSKDSAIARLQRKPYLFEPGTNCKYSNIGYFLLSQIIEKVSGETYATFLRKNIFEKAGMVNTGVSNNDSIVPKKANIYYRDRDGYALNPFINWNLNTGHDGIYATADDLYKLDRALYGETIITEKSKSIMHTHYNKKYPDDGFFDSYGYGIFIDPYYNHGHHLLTHSGGFIGTMTTFDRYPEDNVFIAVLSNNESESHMISYGLSGILFGIPVEFPYQHTAIQIDGKLSKKYAGSYEKTTIIAAGERLYLNNLETELLPESQTKFFRKDIPDRTFEFVKDKKGNVSAVILTKGGVKQRINRTH